MKLYLYEAEQLVPVDFWNYDEVGSSDNGSEAIKKIFGTSVFENPKPIGLVQKILSLLSNENSIILDSFAGSGTTAHAVLKANKKDGGKRRFILVECEDYADTLTAERVRRVINGYDFTGTHREELHREKITWSAFSKHAEKIRLQVEHIEKTKADDYDKIKKEIKEGVLTVTGERKIKDKAPGLGGSFSFCTLGKPIDIESLLTGEGLPSFDALARYVFYTATGQSLETIKKPSADGLIGETELFRIHLFYQPDKKWLRSNEAALNAERIAAIKKMNISKKRAIVFAVAKFISQKELSKQQISFCQLPYAVHRIIGD